MKEVTSDALSRGETVQPAPPAAPELAAPQHIVVITGDEWTKLYPEPVRAFLGFARYCYNIADEIKADAYIAHGIEAMPAADMLVKAVGGRIYCDVIDSPSFSDRGSRDDWHPADHTLLDHAVDHYLRNADGISTVSWAWGSELQHYGPPVTVIPNYRPAEELQPSNELREQCGLGSDDILLLSSSTIYSGFEPVIEALKLLPDNVHLATLGLIVSECRERLHAYPAELGIQDRVHFFDEVPFAQLSSFASSANIGVVALNPEFLNHKLTLPHRVFDSIAAGLPQVALDTPDVARIINEHRIGVIASGNDAVSWAEAIKAALVREQEMRPRVRQAAKELVWESLAGTLRAAYGFPASVTIVSYQNLVGHQRTLRMARTLAQGGATVTICCPHRPRRSPEEIPGVRYVFTPDPVSARDPAPPQPSSNSATQSSPLSVAERERFEELKQECLSLHDRVANYGALEQQLKVLRQKATQYDEIAAQLPALRDKAARYDTLAPDLPTLLGCVAFMRQHGGIGRGARPALGNRDEGEGAAP